VRSRALGQKSKFLAKAVACTAITFICLGSGLCQTKDAAAPASPPSASDLTAGIYGLVSSAGGKVPDWDKVRACFLGEAVIVSRTSRTGTTTFSLEGFIKDFIRFYERPFKIGERTVVPKDSGFSEKVVRMKTWEYGEMAHVLVLYEAQIIGSGAAPQQGVDSWLLVRRDGRWSIAAVTNEVVAPTRPVPTELQTDNRTLQQTPDLATLKAQVERDTKAGNQARALEAAEQMVETTEKAHFEALYVAAHLHAELGHREAAYRFLARATGAGFNDRGRVLREDAFKAFRDEELFRSLVRKAWANGYIGLLERPNREDVQKSPEIMQALAFKPGERVADVGAGSGYFTIPVAGAVGPTGVVWALDIAPEMLEYLDFRIKAQKIENIRLRKVLSDDPQLEPASVDTILMIDTIHYVKDRVGYARRLRQGLAPGGRLVIIDYIPKPMSERPWGPLPEQQISRQQMDADMATAGFKVKRAYDFLPEQYFVVYAEAGK
jgi:ubiquinone/menaquinone biosynthesis C-methylase UbiE